MNLLNRVGDFLLSEWLWSMTFGWSYVVINVISMTFFLWCLMKFSLFRAFILSLVSNAFSFFIYSGVVIGLFIHLLQWWYVPHEYRAQAAPFWANIYLALIHVILQLLFFYAMHKLLDMRKDRLFLTAVVSNCVTAVLSYGYIAYSFWHSI